MIPISIHKEDSEDGLVLVTLQLLVNEVQSQNLAILVENAQRNNTTVSVVKTEWALDSVRRALKMRRTHEH